LYMISLADLFCFRFTPSNYPLRIKTVVESQLL
ncbi:MAG: hypothetical protein ACJA2S_002689, partial [Cyclobacteriaceae bacterium]